MTDQELIDNIRVIEDFPIPGIHFQDITTLLNNPACLQELGDRLYERYKNLGVTKVVGLEARGFILGGVLASRLGAGFIPIRKKGKLPGETFSETYSLEYGTDTIEIHTGTISSDDVVLIHYDLYATGGTMAAATRLIAKFSPKAIYRNCLIELTACPRHPDEEELEVDSPLKIDVD